MRRFTLLDLHRLDACQAHVDLFAEHFPDGATANDVPKAVELGLDVEWFLVHVVSPGVRADYKAKRAALGADFTAKYDALRADYKAKCVALMADALRQAPRPHPTTTRACGRARGGAARGFRQGTDSRCPTRLVSP